MEPTTDAWGLPDEGPAVSWAEDTFAADCLYDDELTEREEPMTPDEVAALVRRVLTARNRAENLPQIEYDGADDPENAGRVSHETGVIHLDPRCARPMLVLHELAHWLLWRDLDEGYVISHGSDFRFTMCALVGAAWGDEYGQTLRNEYDQHVGEVWQDFLGHLGTERASPGNN